VEREPKFLLPASCDDTAANQNRKQRLIVNAVMQKKFHYELDVMSDSVKSFVVNDSMPKARIQRSRMQNHDGDN
jgi:hypothetical protein